jgi:monoamine oxidase
MKKVTNLGKTLKKNDISLASAIEQIVAPMQLTNKQKLFQAYEEHVNIEHEWAGDMHTLSAKNYDEGDEFDGEDHLAVGGYDGIVHGLLSGLDIDLKLRQVVSEIDYSSNNAVNVKIVDGSWVKGDFAICTVPLGVM